MLPSLIHCLIKHTLVVRPWEGPRNTHRSLSSLGKRKTPEVMTYGKAGTSMMLRGILCLLVPLTFSHIHDVMVALDCQLIRLGKHLLSD